MNLTQQQSALWYEVTPSQKTSEFTHQLMLEDNGAGIGANLIRSMMVLGDENWKDRVPNAV